MTLPPAECRVSTPPLLAEAMVRAVAPHRNDYWLDPCMGPGAFIAPLRRHGVPRERIVGIDIDTSVGKEDGAATTVRGIDFFRWCARTRQRFTKIVANPPYVAIRKLHPTLQQSLRQIHDLELKMEANAKRLEALEKVMDETDKQAQAAEVVAAKGPLKKPFLVNQRNQKRLIKKLHNKLL